MNPSCVMTIGSSKGRAPRLSSSASLAGDGSICILISAGCGLRSFTARSSNCGIFVDVALDSNGKRVGSERGSCIGDFLFLAAGEDNALRGDTLIAFLRAVQS